MRTLRNTSILIAALAPLAGCAVKNFGTAPPLDGFAYPMTVALGPSASGEADKVLFVASSNFDLRYNRGTVLAVDLDKVVAANGSLTGPVNQAVDPDTGYALIDSFAGQMLVYQKSGETGAARTVFVTSRNSNSLYAIQANGASLTCPSGGQDCINQGLFVGVSDRIRAENAFGLALQQSSRRLYVTHVKQADNPAGTGNSNTAYIFNLSADAPTSSSIEYVEVGGSPAEGIVDTPMGLYFTGLYIGTGSQALRSLVNGSLADGDLTTFTTLQAAKGIAVSSDGTRLFIATTEGNQTADPLPPEGLVVVDISEGPTTGTAVNRVLGFATLPAGASFVQVIPRVGKRDLVAVSCTQGNAVALYDDELGQLAGVVDGVQEPYGIAVSPSAARTVADQPVRLFVASFGNDTVDVIQVQTPESEPRNATLIGRLGYSAHRPLGVLLPSP